MDPQHELAQAKDRIVVLEAQVADAQQAIVDANSEADAVMHKVLEALDEDDTVAARALIEAWRAEQK